jgi:hypothetical protein
MKHFTVNQKISCIGWTGEEINLRSINFALVSSSGEKLVELGYRAITQEEDSVQFIIHVLNSHVPGSV